MTAAHRNRSFFSFVLLLLLLLHFLALNDMLQERTFSRPPRVQNQLCKVWEIIQRYFSCAMLSSRIPSSQRPRLPAQRAPLFNHDSPESFRTDDTPNWSNNNKISINFYRHESNQKFDSTLLIHSTYASIYENFILYFIFSSIFNSIYGLIYGSISTSIYKSVSKNLKCIQKSDIYSMYDAIYNSIYVSMYGFIETFSSQQPF